MRLLVLLLLIALFPNSGRAENCPRARDANIRVTTRQEMPRMVTSVDIRGLQGLRSGGNVASGDSEHVPLGLAKAEVTHQIQMQAEITTLPNGSVCASLRDVTIEYAFTNTEIYVASELPIGSCAFSQVEEHERRHVATDAQLLREWQFRLQQEGEYAVRSLGTVWDRDQTGALEELKRRLSAKLQESADTLLRERARRQADVDTRMEYDRVSRACNGEIQGFVRKAMGY